MNQRENIFIRCGPLGLPHPSGIRDKRPQHLFENLVFDFVLFSGPSPNKPCIFPFKYNGVTFHGCTLKGGSLYLGSIRVCFLIIFCGCNPYYQPWCSTKVDATGTHVGKQGFWGNCGPQCKTPPKGQKNTLTGKNYLSNGIIWPNMDA